MAASTLRPCGTGFGGVELDTDTYELRSGGHIVEVEPQVFDVLAFLAANRERVVTKEELLDAVWGDRFVSESALTTRIKQARQAVGDDGQAQRVIQTVHGRGYRFVAPVPSTHGPGPSGPGDAALDPVPPTRYVRNDGASIAYQVFGEGPDLVLIEGFTTNVEVQWEHPAIARFLRRLGSFCRVAVLDKRGTGLSERLGPGEAPPLEQRADDVRAVMDAAGMDQAAVFGSSEGGSLAVLLAAAHPERVERLVLHGTWARHPWSGPARPARVRFVERRWGQGPRVRRTGRDHGPHGVGRRFLGRFERQAATPGTARRLTELMSAIDVTALLPSMAVPTLVIHRSDDSRLRPGARPRPGGRHPGRPAGRAARPRPLPVQRRHRPAAGRGRGLRRRRLGGRRPPERFLATVLYAEVVAPDAVPDEVVEAARRCVEAQRGRLVEAAGGAVLATFDGPGAARAACDLRMRWLRSAPRSGPGCTPRRSNGGGDAIAGTGVQVAGRLARAADPGSIWVSRTVTDLVAGCGLAFAPRGEHHLDGLAQPWALYEVAV